ncbi:MAG: methylmalonyl-CoA mutase [Actinobacteria bacterium]|nr:methylmalonyl-CoA mutase [Actinomycetota bacterium]
MREGAEAELVGAEAELAAAYERWRNAVADLAPAETDSGLPVEAVYGPTAADARGTLGAAADEYLERLGFPGEPPFTRGIYPSMYRGRPWTVRLYSGWGTAEDTNERFRYLLERGQTGLSVALDLPTQMGLDSDAEPARAEVGKVGVAVASLADMETIFEGIPLERISTSFTINATAPILLAMYQVVGERQGVDPAQLRGTVQNDILKEYLARKTYIYPPRPSMRLATDVIEYCARTLPKFNPISVCGYHVRQAGSDAVQEIAIAISNGLAYVQSVVDRGIGVDEFAPQISFNNSTMRDIFEEIAKHRAARRIWARLIEERFGSTDPRSCRLRLYSGGDGTSLTAAEPHNNIMRIALQALTVVLSGAQAVHTMSWDEALGLPSEESVLLALRTQQILAHESGVARTADPLGGSYYVEALTDELERRIDTLIAKIEENGGIVAGIEDGSLEQAIAESAYEQQRQIEAGERVIVGVNAFAEEGGEEPVETFQVGADVLERQLARLRTTRAERDEAAVAAALAGVEAAARGSENTMPAIVAAVRAYATTGEISDALGRVFGRHTGSTVI